MTRTDGLPMFAPADWVVALELLEAVAGDLLWSTGDSAGPWTCRVCGGTGILWG